MKPIEDYVFLKQSLIFQMSLGSKELFHSNVWAWLIEQNPEYIKVFFSDFDSNRYEYVSVDREKYHRDLIIWVKETTSKRDKTHYLVIENKFKSIPTEKQLAEYSVELDKCPLLSAVLTGIENHLQNKVFNGITWDFLSYCEIADRINALNNSSKKLQIREYCNVIKALYRLIKTGLEEIGDCLLVDQWDEKYKTFNELRINDLLKKANGARFFRFLLDHKLQETLEDAEIKAKGYKVCMQQSFHNNKVTIDVYYITANETQTNYFRIGIQTEGKQYRRIACRNAQYGKQKLFDDLAPKGWFDVEYDSKETPRIVFGYISTMKSTNKYNSYNPESFVYQHIEIHNDIDNNDDNGCKQLDNSFDALYLKILEDMLFAKSIILSIS